MTHHDLMILALGGDLALVAVASIQFAAEARWRRRCARRERLAEATVVEVEKP